MKSLLPCVVPAMVLAAFWSGRPWAFSVPIWIYLAAMLLDFVAGEDREDEQTAPFTLRLFTWLWLPLNAAVIATGLIAVTTSSSLHTLYVVSIGAGAISGMFGIPVAHELMHRESRFERALAELQMTLFSYTHFCIEHVEGHHHNVGLRRDPATARYGETLYAFLPRSVFGGFVSACRLDRIRVIRYLLGIAIVYGAVALTFGWRGVVFFAAQSAVGILIIEVINYVEHYGLVRQESEPVTNRHSWNSSHRISNWLMFNVPRHSDHHADAERPYPLLRHARDARQLPAGYFAMFVLALFPPLWRLVMDPLIEVHE
jgi:alkane 1-monooxygenase